MLRHDGHVYRGGERITSDFTPTLTIPKVKGRYSRCDLSYILESNLCLRLNYIRFLPYYIQILPFWDKSDVLSNSGVAIMGSEEAQTRIMVQLTRTMV